MHADVVIVGGGMVGCAVAAHLSTHCRVLLLEAGPAVAAEGAAQSAGMIRRLDAEPSHRALAQRTFTYLENCETPGLSERTGAILGLVRDPLGLHDAVAHLRAHGIAVRALDARTVPLLADSPVTAAWSLPEERVTSGPSLASHLLDRARANGAVIHTSEATVRLLLEGGRCIGVQTSARTIHAEYTVLAAGAWSGQLVEGLGLNRPLIPLRRTAARIQSIQSKADPRWIWLDDVGLYARPEGDGWIVSPCDEQPSWPEPGVSSTQAPDSAQWALLRQKISRYFPSMRHGTVSRGWTGLRTFCPDRRPMLGPDEDCPGLVWAAGLGGHGVSGCVGAAEAITAWLRGEITPWLDRGSVAPTRPQLHRWPIFPSGDPARAKLINVASPRSCPAGRRAHTPR